MLEALLVAAFVALLGGAALAWSLAGIEALLIAALWLVGAGLVLGVPTGFWYHVELRRVLLRAGALPPRWWLYPTRHHGAIPPERWWRVMSWCYAGAVGWVISFAGCLVFALGAAKLLLAE
jgi:hypothetical protein